MPLARPVTVQDSPVVEHVAPPGLAVTVYPVIADPPLEFGVAHDTVAWPLPDVAVTPVGAPGTVAGIVEAEGAEARLVPIALVALTVKV